MHRRSVGVELLVVGVLAGALSGVLVRLTADVVATTSMTLLVRLLLSIVAHPLLAVPFSDVLLTLVIVVSGGLGGVVGAIPGYLVATWLFAWLRPAGVRWLVCWSVAGVLVAAVPTVHDLLTSDTYRPLPVFDPRWAVFGMGEGLLVCLVARHWWQDDSCPTSSRP